MNADGSTNALRILYYGAGWPTNIGNAFIDLGAIALLRRAVPDAEIAFASEMPRWFFKYSHDQSKVKKSWRFGRWRFDIWDVNERASKCSAVMENALDVAALAKCDLLVYAGMAMCEEFVEVNGPSVLTLSKQGTPVLLLGTGALTYSEDERRLYKDFLREINVIGFVSRDDRSYEMFKDLVPKVHKGIDCAFFVPEAYTPLSLKLPPYIVATFDSMPEPAIDLRECSLKRAHHDCWSLPRLKYTETCDTLISDIPYDYLTLYANAEEVHSDRVHACVAALAYGRRARLYHPTPRGSLFEAAGFEHIRDNLVQPDMQLLAQKKAAQVEVIKQLLTEL